MVTILFLYCNYRQTEGKGRVIPAKAERQRRAARRTSDDKEGKNVRASGRGLHLPLQDKVEKILDTGDPQELQQVLQGLRCTVKDIGYTLLFPPLHHTKHLRLPRTALCTTELHEREHSQSLNYKMCLIDFHPFTAGKGKQRQSKKGKGRRK